MLRRSSLAHVHTCVEGSLGMRLAWVTFVHWEGGHDKGYAYMISFANSGYFLCLCIWSTRHPTKQLEQWQTTLRYACILYQVQAHSFEPWKISHTQIWGNGHSQPREWWSGSQYQHVQEQNHMLASFWPCSTTRRHIHMHIHMHLHMHLHNIMTHLK